MTDKMLLTGLMFVGHHGCSAAEQEVGQRIRVSAELSLDLRQAARTDDLRHAENWSTLYQEIKAIVEERRFALVEALTEAIAQQLLEHDRVSQVVVRVEKLQPPFFGPVESVGIEVVRTRAGE